MAVFTSPNVRSKMLNGEKVQKGELETLTLTLLTETPGIYLVDREFFNEIKSDVEEMNQEREFDIESRLVPICRACYSESLIG